MSTSRSGPSIAEAKGEWQAREVARWERLPFGLVLLAVWAVALVAIALLVTGGLRGLNGLLGRDDAAGGAPSYQELTVGERNAELGRDFVIAPADATPQRIEALVTALAADSPPGLLRMNVFTDAAAARRRRELIAAGIYAKNEDEGDPPEWREVYPAWVGVYTRDPANNVNQLSICLNDPDHSHCTVKRYPPVAAR
ncbi:MAG TPA: hypothetical protein VK066_23180 [Chloroflexota bacterium]|nr:hypothetical protein [Chloroflexota bacterium]